MMPLLQRPLEQGFANSAHGDVRAVTQPQRRLIPVGAGDQEYPSGSGVRYAPLPRRPIAPPTHGDDHPAWYGPGSRPAAGSAALHSAPALSAGHQARRWRSSQATAYTGTAARPVVLCPSMSGGGGPSTDI